jgi:hypothetical protein
MTTDSLFKTQAAVYARLTAAAGLTAQLAQGADSIMDDVPDNSAFPYIVIGDMTARAMDTQGTTGREVTAAIHSYSRGRGMKDIKSIMSAVFDVLHNGNLSVSGQTIILCQEISAEAYLEGDGETRHGIQRFRIITEPA